MSAYITCIVRRNKTEACFNESKEKTLMKIQELIRNDDQIGVFIDSPNMSNRFWESREEYDGAFVFSIADGKIYDNCEHLIRIDWVNEWENAEWGTLDYRLEKIQKLLECVLEFNDELELFMGEYGDNGFEYETRKCSIDNFVSVMIDEFLDQSYFCAPEIHLVVSKNAI